MASLNVRDFKLINEKFGSKEGDDTLRYIYHVLSETLKPGELAARGAADNLLPADGQGGTGIGQRPFQTD